MTLTDRLTTDLKPKLIAFLKLLGDALGYMEWKEWRAERTFEKTLRTRRYIPSPTDKGWIELWGDKEQPDDFLPPYELVKLDDSEEKPAVPEEPPRIEFHRTIKVNGFMNP